MDKKSHVLCDAGKEHAVLIEWLRLTEKVTFKQVKQRCEGGKRLICYIIKCYFILYILYINT